MPDMMTVVVLIYLYLAGQGVTPNFYIIEDSIMNLAVNDVAAWKGAPSRDF